MDTDSYVPIPPDLQARMRALSNDLQRAKRNLETGKLRPDHYPALQRVLDARLRDIEAEVEFRLLNETRMGRPAPWQVKRGPGGAS